MNLELLILRKMGLRSLSKIIMMFQNSTTPAAIICKDPQVFKEQFMLNLKILILIVRFHSGTEISLRKIIMLVVSLKTRLALSKATLNLLLLTT